MSSCWLESILEQLWNKDWSKMPRRVVAYHPYGHENSHDCILGHSLISYELEIY